MIFRGEEERTAIPLRGMVQRFAFVLLTGAAIMVLVLGKVENPLVERIRWTLFEVSAPVLEVLSRPVVAVTHLVNEARSLTLIRDENLGCKKAVYEAINWFFENESEGIILEDDLLPSQSFFWYCQELLDYYRDDNRIMHIGGSNFQFGRNRSPYDYYFSRYAHVWGWATWKKSWQHYKDIDYWSSKKLKELFTSLESSKDFIKYWNNEMQKVKSGKIDTWDYQWTFTCWEKNGLSILPDINLVSNIGFGKNATHTKKFNPVSNIPNQEICFPLHHPIKIIRSKKRDSYTEFGQFFKPFFLRLIYKFFGSDRIKKNIF